MARATPQRSDRRPHTARLVEREPGVRAGRPRRPLDDTRADPVGIVTRLVAELERFDLILQRQRETIEHLGASDEASRQSERISHEAADLVSSAREALEQLGLLCEAHESPIHAAR